MFYFAHTVIKKKKSLYQFLYFVCLKLFIIKSVLKFKSIVKI